MPKGTLLFELRFSLACAFNLFKNRRARCFQLIDCISPPKFDGVCRRLITRPLTNFELTSDALPFLIHDLIWCQRLFPELADLFSPCQRIHRDLLLRLIEKGIGIHLPNLIVVGFIVLFFELI